MAIPTPSPTMVMHAINATMGVANNNKTPSPMQTPDLLAVLTALAKNPGDKNNSSSPNRKLSHPRKAPDANSRGSGRSSDRA